MKLDESKLLLLFSGILTGIVLVAFLVNSKTNPTRFLTLKDYQYTSNQLNVIKSEIKSIYKEYAELNTKLYNYEHTENLNSDIIKTLEKEVKDLRKFYGNSIVNGPGIKLTVNDRYKEEYIDEFEQWSSIVHDRDLLGLVNDLKNGGAEAISINGERISVETAITCEGPLIKVNNEYVAPPFIITAIGDPDSLLYSFSLEGSAYENMVSRELYVYPEKQANVEIPGNGNLIMNYDPLAP